MKEQSVYSDAESFRPDRLYPDGFGEVLFLVKGEPFTKTFRIQNLAGGELELPQKRRVIVAVMQDQDQYMWCEPYNPEMHGEEMDLESISLEEFSSNPEFFDAWESLERVLKGGSSKPSYNMEHEWRRKGADPSFRMPKQIYNSGKLK
jgi:hypothetical protein